MKQQRLRQRERLDEEGSGWHTLRPCSGFVIQMSSMKSQRCESSSLLIPKLLTSVFLHQLHVLKQTLKRKAITSFPLNKSPGSSALLL